MVQYTEEVEWWYATYTHAQASEGNHEDTRRHEDITKDTGASLPHG